MRIRPTDLDVRGANAAVAEINARHWMMSLKPVSANERCRNSAAAICAAIKMLIAPIHNLETRLKNTPPGHSRRQTVITYGYRSNVRRRLSHTKMKPAMLGFLPASFFYSIICG